VTGVQTCALPISTALQLLDRADEASPNEPAFANLRGEILMEQKKFDEAETVLRKAVAADPKFREAQYNLAQIPFRQGQYAKARERLENLFSAMPGDEKDQAAQLIKFKIFMTLLLEGREAQAQQLMDQFKFTGDTPALYYAQSAWEFKHGHKEQGEDWVTSARKIYSPALNVIFADAFAGLGWLGSSENGTGPATSALALADSSPTAEATPTMRLGQAESLPAPEVATQDQTVATETPTSSQAPTPAAPIVAAKPTAQPAAPVVAKTSPTVETRPASSPAATIVASTQKRSTAKPTLAERVDSVSNPRTFFVGGLLLAGILLLAGLVVQQFRRSLFTTPLFKSATPLTDPPFSEDQSTIADESTAPSGGLIASGPPKLSLNLKASEPSVRAAVLPSGAITARGIAPGVDEPAAASPNEINEFVSEAVPATLQEQKIPAAAEEPPLRDVQEISIPAEMPAAAIEATAEAPIVAAPALEMPAIKAPVAAVPAVEMPADEPPITAGPETGLIAAPIAPTPAAETPVIEIPATELPALSVPAFAATAHLVEQAPAPEPATEALSEPVILEEEPVGQGEPVPELTTALVAEPVISELTQPEPESNLVLIEPEETVAAPIAARETVQSSIETPAFASKILSTEPTRLQPTTPYHMPETTITPVAPAARPSASTMSVQQPAGGMHTAVQLTFSLEIASMQLTPTFKMSGLQLKPTSKVVSMRLAPSQDPQPPMNLQVTFEVAQIDLSGGTIGTVRLSPSGREKPAVLSSPSFAISGLELVSGAGAAPVQLTPLHQEQASVHLTAHFQIAAIEFTPMFEIAAIVLNSTSRDVFMQLPGSGPTSIDSAPVFKMENVQLNGTDIGLIQVVPAVGSLHG